MNNIAYCGLVCCVCSENDKCVGLFTGGAKITTAALKKALTVVGNVMNSPDILVRNN